MMRARADTPNPSRYTAIRRLTVYNSDATTTNTFVCAFVQMDARTLSIEAATDLAGSPSLSTAPLLVSSTRPFAFDGKREREEE
jgi:hypothetical protein